MCSTVSRTHGFAVNRSVGGGSVVVWNSECNGEFSKVGCVKCTCYSVHVTVYTLQCSLHMYTAEITLYSVEYKV